MLDLRKDIGTILDSIAGLIVIDSNAVILYMDRKTLRLIGIESQEEVLGKDIREVIPNEDNRLYHVLETGEPNLGDIYVYEGDFAVVNQFPIYDGAGKLVGALEYDSFNEYSDVSGFLKSLKEANEAADFYKGAYKELRTAKYSIDSIAGQSESILRLKDEIREVALTDSNVLIYGETGCGKELVAQAIHSSSRRQLQNFVAVNCSTIPSGLFESELFGYEAGSFTGASKGGKKGKVEWAEGGTLFLDEVDQLPLADQPKLLRFLQEREIVKVGGVESIPVDVKIICATNRNLRKLVAAKEFRQDLYYRLNVVELRLIPLRERKEDIVPISLDIIERLNDTLGRVSHRVDAIDDQAAELLCSYEWPGNVRELQNVLERAMNRCRSTTMTVKCLEDFAYGRGLHAGPGAEAAGAAETAEAAEEEIRPLKESVEAAEKHAIVNAMRLCGDNKALVSRNLGISRETLYQKIRKYGIEA